MPAPPSLLLAALLGFGVLGNGATVQLLPGVELVFGSIATLVVVRGWGPWWGLLSAVLGSAAALALWGHPLAFLVFPTEALIVGALLPRTDDNLPLADAAYWLLIGMPIVLLTTFGLLQVVAGDAEVSALKHAVNGIFNALIANVLIDHTPLLGRRAMRTVPLRRLLFNLLTVLVLGSTLFMSVLGAREELRGHEAEVLQLLAATHQGLVSRVQSWNERHLRTVQLLADEVRDLGWDAERLQLRVELVRDLSDEYHNVLIADANGVTVAYAPRATPQGTPNVGMDISDRTYFDPVRRSRRPMITEVFPRPLAVPEHTLAYVAPIEAGQTFDGFALVALDLDEARSLLERHVGGTGIRAVLVDHTARIIVSTDPAHRVGAPHDPAREARIEHHGDWFEWIPEQPGPPLLQRRPETERYGLVGHVGPPSGWRTYLDLSLTPLREYLNRRLVRRLGVMLGLTLLVLPIAQLVGGWITGPLSLLATQSTDLPRRLEAGRGVVWPRSRIREIDALATNFDQMTEALIGRMTEMASADRAKDDFLAMLGHELRNPLAPVMTAATLLRQTSEGPVRERALAVLERQTRHMVRLVDDLLDLSRITRGRIELREAVLDLRGVVRAAVDNALPAAHEVGHTVTVAQPDDPVWVRGDETRLEQVVANLLNNAIKYTPAGGHIDVESKASGDTVTLVVQDDGVGMDDELLRIAFEPFRQGGRSLDRSQGGMGIGLTLVRRLVQLHGGRVRAESEGEGKGTRAVVELPSAEEPMTSVTRDGEQREVVSRTVLVVDDNLDAADLLAELLRHWGHDVSTAHDGATALQWLQDTVPDVIFLDIGLPGRSGYEVAADIRKDPRLGGVFLVALTGYGQQEDRERSRDAGFDVHLTKPVDLDEVERVLAQLDQVPT